MLSSMLLSIKRFTYCKKRIGNHRKVSIKIVAVNNIQQTTIKIRTIKMANFMLERRKAHESMLHAISSFRHDRLTDY